MVPARPLISAFMAGLLLMACSDEPRSPSGPSAAERAAQAAYVRDQSTWRAQRLAELRQPDGWLSLVGLHWLTPGAHYVGSAADNGIRPAVGPEQLGKIDVRPPRLRLLPHRGAGLAVDGSVVRGGVDLRADDAQEGPSRITFDDGRGVATIIHRGDRYALRVKHADAPTRIAFTGIEFWPGGRGWIVAARFVPHRPTRTLPIANIVGTIEATPNPGVLVFSRSGREYRLEALEGEGGGLFLIFADRTSGHGSYGAGRYLDTAAPDARGRVRLDFNRTYNPPCAFTSFATCPLPPPENRLDLTVDAGEKAYTGLH